MNTSLTCDTTPIKKENSRTYYEPKYAVDRSGDETLLRVELPGVAKEDLEISVENRELYLEGKVSIKRPDSWKILYRESFDRTYQLRLRLGDQVDQASIVAELENGILSLTLPKSEAAKPQKISIK